jgi:3-oxoacyl-[acyl-carrier-protein] synthase III
MSAGMLSLAVRYPSRVVTNEHVRSLAPHVVAEAEQKTLARLWAGQRKSAAERGAWSIESEPYLGDPFRGTVLRRHFAGAESVLSLETAVGKEAIERAGLKPSDIDLLISTAFLPDQIGVGNSAFLCRELGLSGAAWNLETACSSSLVALETATALVEAKQYNRVLVVVSCDYSRHLEPHDSFGWFLGDGAAAFVVGPTPRGEGLLAQHTIHTAQTCGTFRWDLDLDPAGKPWIYIRATENAGQVLAANLDDYLRTTTRTAVAKAGMTLDDIDLFVCNTPTAWFNRWVARSLEIDVERTVTTYPLVANCGPMLMPANLHWAASRGRVPRGANVLLFSVGSVSSTSAAVMCAGDLALGEDPLAGAQLPPSSTPTATV